MPDWLGWCDRLMGVDWIRNFLLVYFGGIIRIFMEEIGSCG